MAYPEKLTFAPKYNLRPIVEPNGQFSAENANEVFEKVNKNALFHGSHPDLTTLQTVHPEPPVGAFAYLQDGSHYKCVSVGWKKSPGISPYDLAVQNGYVGDLTSWLASLVGTSGTTITAAPTELFIFTPNWQSGLTFLAFAVWVKDGITYNDTREITLSPADATLDRFDLFVVNLTTDQLEIIEGAPGNPAVEPSYNPLLFLGASFVSVKAGAIAPDGVSSTPIWTEGSEWLATNTGGAFDFANTESPASGTYAIKVISPLGNGHSLPFTPPAAVPVVEGMEIQYKIKNIVGGAHRFMVSGLKSNGKLYSLWIDAPINFDRLNLTTYQFLSVLIPTGILTSITKIHLVAGVSGIKYFLDDVRLVTGGGNVVTGSVSKEYVDAQDAATLQASKDYSDSLNHSGGGTSMTDAEVKTAYENNADTNAFTDILLAKINSITAIFTTTLKTAYDTASGWVSANGANVVSHIQSTHAPSTAQKNSDITKAEIEAKLTGEIATHTHAASGGLDIRLANVAGDLTAAERIALLAKINEPAQVTKTVTASFTSEALSDSNYSQNGKNVLIKNSTNAINITVGATANFVATYLKIGTGAITFIASSGKTIVPVNGTSVMNGAAGSTTSVSVDGNKIYVLISNAV